MPGALGRAMLTLSGLLVLGSGGCGGDMGSVEETPAADSLVQTAEELPVVDPVGEMRRVDSPVARTSRTYRLLLVNPGPAPVTVRAEAGADTVSVESVAAGDSTRVDLVVRSDSVRLFSAEASRLIRLPTLRFPADSVRRLELGSP